MSNVNAIGTALASYTADYNGFYPSSPGLIGPEMSWCRNAEGEPVTDRSCVLRHVGVEDFTTWPSHFNPSRYRHRPTDLDGGVLIQGKQTYMTPHFWRAIGSSCNWDPSGASVKHAPNGVGMLLTSAYLDDARVFYCPAAEAGEMPGLYDHWRKNGYTYGGYRVEDWENAGGFDAETMLYGDWRKAMFHYRKGNQLFSHYAYRNVMTGARNPRHWYQCDDPSVTGIPGTYPVVTARPMQPAFPTEKILAGRALLVDAFGKGVTKDAHGAAYPGLGTGFVLESEVSSTTFAGMGIKAHRASYNVLYGDGHAEVFSDPEEKLVWHAQTHATSSSQIRFSNFRANGNFGLLCLNYWSQGTHAYPFALHCGDDPTHFKFRGSSLEVWHELDAAAGVDME